jgi:hypothetical protein
MKYILSIITIFSLISTAVKSTCITSTVCIECNKLTTKDIENRGQVVTTIFASLFLNSNQRAKITKSTTSNIKHFTIPQTTSCQTV